MWETSVEQFWQNQDTGSQLLARLLKVGTDIHGFRDDSYDFGDPMAVHLLQPLDQYFPLTITLVHIKVF